MTPRERFLARVQRRLRGVEPELVRTYLAGIRAVLAVMPEREVARIIRERGLLGLLARLSDEALALAFAPHRLAVRHEVERGTMFFGRDIPGVAEAQVRASFGVLNPRVMDAIRTLDNVVTRRLADTVRESVRGIVEGALARGASPLEAAKQMRGLLGLSPSEQRQIQNFRDALEGKNGRRWQDYARRDRTLDAVIQRAEAAGGLTPAQVDRMVRAYTRRRLALVAESHARTAMLDSYRTAQDTAWRTALENGWVEADGLTKEWLTVRDSRVRPHHQEMHGQRVPFDAPYSTGQMIPGEGEWNCRCWSRVFVAA